MSQNPEVCETKTHEVWIERFLCPAIVGVYTHERQVPQPLWISAQLILNQMPDNQLAFRSRVQSHILAQKNLNHPYLIERLCLDLIASLFASFSIIEKATIKIEKPCALADAQNVGIHMQRSRNDWNAALIASGSTSHSESNRD